VRGVDDARDVPKSAIAGGTVVVLRTGAPALGLDIDTGQVLWRGAVLVDAVSIGGTVVAATEENAEVVALRARTGEVRWTRPVLRAHQELAVAPDHHVLVLDSDFLAHVIEG
jgi:outer membrane protein assembly factor BamB